MIAWGQPPSAVLSSQSSTRFTTGPPVGQFQVRVPYPSWFSKGGDHEPEASSLSVPVRFEIPTLAKGARVGQPRLKWRGQTSGQRLGSPIAGKWDVPRQHLGAENGEHPSVPEFPSQSSVSGDNTSCSFMP